MGYRYIGSKVRILEQLLGKIDTLVPSGAHVTDLMCGTASVATELRRKGYSVTAVDVMTYSYHHAVVGLLFSELPLFQQAQSFIEEFAVQNDSGLFLPTEYEKMLHALQNLPGRKGYFWNEMSLEGNPKNTEKPRNYFSPDNARRIDVIRESIKHLHDHGKITDLEHSLLLHDLIMAANDVANIAGTYGHHMADLMGRARDTLELKPTSLEFCADTSRYKVLQGYAEELAKDIECDLCYIDPPYMKRQYAANYHVLETLAREDEPEAIGVSGLRPWRDQYSNFCTKTKIRDSFRKIFKNMRCPQFLISYSQDGLLSVDELTELFSEFGRVNVSTFGHKRFKSNNSQLKPALTEYLIHLEKKCGGPVISNARASERPEHVVGATL